MQSKAKYHGFQTPPVPKAWLQRPTMTNSEFRKYFRTLIARYNNPLLAILDADDVLARRYNDDEDQAELLRTLSM